MTWLYLRWGFLLIIMVFFAMLIFRNYEQNLSTMTPERVLTETPIGDNVRVQGLVKGGTLVEGPKQGQARFDLAGEERETLSISYNGPPQENLRELKILIVVGQWDPALRLFKAGDITLVTNYGFVLTAYVIGIIPLALLLFFMDRKVGELFNEIKQAKLYEVEDDPYVEFR